MKIKKNKTGQTIVEYVVLGAALIGIFLTFIPLFCNPLDNYLQGIYALLQSPVP